MNASAGHLFEIRDLEVAFHTRAGTASAVRGVSLALDDGQTLGLVGESGCGKSTTAMAALGLIQLPGEVIGGDVLWRGESLLDKKVADRVRGKELAMINQDPMSSLNPIITVGAQMAELMTRHLDLTRKAAWSRAADLLEMVDIPNPGRRLKRYPFEFSGGMQQRILIAMALSCEPKLLIADEPTTALDVTIQAQMLELIASLQESLDLALMLITHDLGVVAGVCDRVSVMYAGKIVESGTTDEIFLDPRHPYSAALVSATPRLDMKRRRLPVIEGVPPSPIDPAPGCSFYPRCGNATAECTIDQPTLEALPGGRQAACIHPITLDEAAPSTVEQRHG